MRAKKPSKNKGSVRTSLWLTRAAHQASEKKAAKRGISRGQYVDQLIRRDTGLDVGVDLDEQPNVFG